MGTAGSGTRGPVATNSRAMAQSLIAVNRRSTELTNIVV